jgi:hypothetical protein
MRNTNLIQPPQVDPAVVLNKKRALELPPDFSTRAFFSEPPGFGHGSVDFPPEINSKQSG